MKLLDLIRDNPTLPIVPMVNYEVIADDQCSYWAGSFGDCRVDQTYSSDERIYFRGQDEEELVDDYIDANTDLVEDSAELDKIAQDIVDALLWKDCIVVYIELPEVLK